MVLRTLTEEEKAARAKALGNARIAEAEARAARAADKEARRQAWAAKREAEGWHEASDDDTQGKE